MGEKRKINKDVFGGIILAAIAGFFLYETRAMRPVAAQFPRIIFVTLIIMSLLLFALGLRKTFKPELWKETDFLLSIKVVRTPIIFYGIFVGYLVLMHFTSFFIATVVFVPVCMIFFGTKNVRLIILTTVFLNLFMYIVFVRVLRVWLP